MEVEHFLTFCIISGAKIPNILLSSFRKVYFQVNFSSHFSRNFSFIEKSKNKTQRVLCPIIQRQQIKALK